MNIIASRSEWRGHRSSRRIMRGLSFAPILIATALVSMIAVPSMFQSSLHQNITSNTLSRTQVYHDANAELYAQRNWYNNPDRLGPITETAQAVNAPITTTATLLDANIVRKPGLTDCPGSTQKCVNYEISLEIDNSSMLTRTNQVIGFQIVQP